MLVCRCIHVVIKSRKTEEKKIFNLRETVQKNGLSDLRTYFIAYNI